ncbi:HPP family protein [Streptomyces sp. NPDC048483]|uniref:HPP family protein n=1 Tax=Streptomyces sp. NPDC048483 TaxID=3154927 RepID=UPI003436FB07
MSLDHAEVAAPPQTTVSPQTTAPEGTPERTPGPFGGHAPAPPSPAAALHILSGATAVLLALVAIGTLVHQAVLIPPLAASAALVHSAPTQPLAQPRSVIGGHLLSAGTGYGVLAAFGHSPWAAAAAAALALGAMMLTRTPHSPACATAVIVVLQGPDPLRFLAALLGATVLLVLAGYAASRARRKAPVYPAYWW